MTKSGIELDKSICRARFGRGGAGRGGAVGKLQWIYLGPSLD